MTRDINYCKAILNKVSFDPNLFKKEFKKAYSLLDSKERLQLEDWVKGFIQNKQALRSILLSNTGALTLG